MSTLATTNTQSPWLSPKDPQHLKRRHMRRNTCHSRTSSYSMASAPSSSFTSLSDKNYSTTSPRKNRSRRDEELNGIDSVESCHISPAQPPRIKTSYLGNQRGGLSDGDIDDFDKSSQQPATAVVPSWFGSLRSFAISASSSSRGAFAPLTASSKSRSSPSSSSSSSSCSSSSYHAPSRGRSSSIYYAGHLSDDSDSDYNSENNCDEPITNKNGLKENRVRGPRMSWAMLDPSLGGLFPPSYKALSALEPELSSPSCSSSASSIHSPTLFNVEDLAVSDVPHRDDQDTAEKCRVHEDDYWTEDRKSMPGDIAPSIGNEFASAYPTPAVTSAASSAFSFIKSYVPILPSFQDANSSTLSSATAPSASAPQSGFSQSSSTITTSGSSFWSIRKLSLNLMSSHQYAAVDGSASDDERDGGYDGLSRYGSVTYHSDSSTGSSGDDFNDRIHGREDDDKEENYGAASFPATLSTSCSTVNVVHTSSSASLPLSSSYLGSMLSNASSTVAAKGSQYISSQVRDNLEHLPVSISTRSLKKIGRTD
ncbi:hypothetical protein EDD11_000976 [Mortierella claussenii]|nr:hypothetical protein EDD11_000976 [Mortierella claussenii]